MSFGQSPGPQAGGRLMAELLSLLQEAGYAGYRDARGPMGFTQRQGNGKFTHNEAEGFIAQLQEEAEAPRSDSTDSHEEPAPAPVKPARKTAKKRAGKTAKAGTPPPENPSYAKALRKVPDEQLAAELARRGWTVEAPGTPAF